MGRQDPFRIGTSEAEAPHSTRDELIRPWPVRLRVGSRFGHVREFLGGNVVRTKVDSVGKVNIVHRRPRAVVGRHAGVPAVDSEWLCGRASDSLELRRGDRLEVTIAALGHVRTSAGVDVAGKHLIAVEKARVPGETADLARLRRGHERPDAVPVERRLEEDDGNRVVIEPAQRLGKVRIDRLEQVSARSGWRRHDDIVDDIGPVVGDEFVASSTGLIAVTGVSSEITSAWRS